MNLNDLITTMRSLADSQVGIIVKIDEAVELLTLELWVLDQFQETEQESTTLEQKWSNTHQLGVQYLRELRRANMALGIGAGGNITVTRGQLMHNDVLIGTKYEFNVRLTTDCATGTFE
jgi:hypothetical protein